MVYLICPVQTEVTEVCDFIAFKVSLNMIKKLSASDFWRSLHREKL